MDLYVDVMIMYVSSWGWDIRDWQTQSCYWTVAPSLLGETVCGRRIWTTEQCCI